METHPPSPGRAGLEERTSEPDVLIAHQDGVTTLTLNRPAVHNALRSHTWLGLTHALRTPPRGTRAVVITGAGSSFCSGGDLLEMAETFRSPAGVAQFRRMIAATFEAISEAPFPVIAAIDGAAMGGGAEIALACDVRIITPRARMSMPGTKFGLALNAAEIERVARLIGPSKTTYWITTGEPVDATTALAWGLADEVATDANGRALELASHLSRTSSEVNRWTKAVLEGRNSEAPDSADATLMSAGLDVPGHRTSGFTQAVDS